MEKIITNINGNSYLNDDDNYIASVLEDLERNNTAFPDIIDLYEYEKTVKKVPEEYKDEKTGETKTRKVPVKKTTLRVCFADDTWTEVVKSDEDKYDVTTAILYAIVKRLLGVPTKGGYVVGNGFMPTLKRLAKSVRTEKSEEEEKQQRLKNKEEADKKAHEEAVKRREKNPDLGVRVNSLEKSVATLVETLSKYFNK